MPPVGQKRALKKGADSAFSAGNSARRFGGEEFEAVEPEVEPAHDVACGRDPRKIGDPRVARRQRERLGQAGRDDEAAAGVDRLVQLRAR